MAEYDSKVDLNRKSNEDGTQNIANEYKSIGYNRLYLFSNYVFDSQETELWNQTTMTTNHSIFTVGLKLKVRHSYLLP